jgi:hypothetical protein
VPGFRLHRLPHRHATPRAARCCEAIRSQPAARDPAAHDASTRLLHRREPDPEARDCEVEPLVDRGDGVLVVDDSTPDKFHATRIKPVHRHWSGQPNRVAWGINLITLARIDGDRAMPRRWTTASTTSPRTA